MARPNDDPHRRSVRLAGCAPLAPPGMEERAPRGSSRRAGGVRGGREAGTTVAEAGRPVWSRKFPPICNRTLTVPETPASTGTGSPGGRVCDEGSPNRLERRPTNVHRPKGRRRCSRHGGWRGRARFKRLRQPRRAAPVPAEGDHRRSRASLAIIPIVLTVSIVASIRAEKRDHDTDQPPGKLDTVDATRNPD